MTETPAPAQDLKDFFISYSSKDKHWAEWIATVLEAEGLRVVIQAWDFGVGDNFLLRMHEAASTCQRTLLVLSPESLKSDWVKVEWAAALKADPTGKARKLAPVRVEPCRPEGLLGPIVYSDLVGLPEAEARQCLLMDLSTERRKRTAPFPGTAAPAQATAPARVDYPGAQAPQYKGVLIYCCAADEDLPFVKELEKQLFFAERNGTLTLWHTRKGGLGLNDEAQRYMDEAPIILLFVTPELVPARFDQIVEAKRRSQDRSARVIPIHVKSADAFSESGLEGNVALPRSPSQPIATWRHQDQAWADIAKELRALAEQMAPKKA